MKKRILTFTTTPHHEEELIQLYHQRPLPPPPRDPLSRAPQDRFVKTNTILNASPYSWVRSLKKTLELLKLPREPLPRDINFWWFTYIVIIFIGNILIPATLHLDMVDNCGIERCAKQYIRAVSDMDITQGSNPGYCHLLKFYRQCLENSSSSCRGNLNFHTTRSLVSQWFGKYNCDNVIRRATRKKAATPSHHNRYFSPSPPKRMGASGSRMVPSGSVDDVYAQLAAEPKDFCHYRRSPKRKRGGGTFNNLTSPEISKTSNPPHYPTATPSRYVYCALFGDPHLIRYDGTFETCRIARAWPLVNNAYFSVQVTSEPVTPTNTYYATAVTHVTVIVKQQYPCAEEKTYEARAGHLPSTFLDGTYTAGLVDDRSVYIRARKSGLADTNFPESWSPSKTNSHVVDIKLRYIGTTISVRSHLFPSSQSSSSSFSYLSIAIRTPREFSFPPHTSNFGPQMDELDPDPVPPSRFSPTPAYFSRENVRRYWEEQQQQRPQLINNYQLQRPEDDLAPYPESTTRYLELCSTGCPHNELIDLGNFFKRAAADAVSSLPTTTTKRHKFAPPSLIREMIDQSSLTTKKHKQLSSTRNIPTVTTFSSSEGKKKRNGNSYFAPTPGTLINHRFTDSEQNLGGPSWIRDDNGRHVSISASQSSIMNLDRASHVCKERGLLTDLFFDACVYDLLNTGNSGFVHASRFALHDYARLMGTRRRRHHYPAPKSPQPSQTRLSPGRKPYYHDRSSLDLLSRRRTYVLFDYYNIASETNVKNEQLSSPIITIKDNGYPYNESDSKSNSSSPPPALSSSSPSHTTRLRANFFIIFVLTTAMISVPLLLQDTS